ncbi:glycerophosphodiester phosphodiesterase family protein [Microbacterium karelineae]|uniref:glycerophosphodiester phosphodiesterase family protein n=1 Tax=Microbacterium karelineae TaxID=2654283 RepID=UPI0012E9B07A|nr:glycerophosphodiester phosphodiesterase family protein [Microbacterium karelineae]
MTSPAERHAYLRGADHPRVLAHRGLVTPDMRDDGIVENSFAAIAAAHSAGAEYVESDCHLTADGEVVLFHDSDLARVVGDPRRIAQVPLAELESLMADRGGLATLAQALDAFPDVRFNIDVKADAAADPAGRLVAPHADRVLLTSFDDARRRRALRSARAAGGEPATSGGRGVVLGAVLASLLPFEGLVARALRGVDALQVPERQGVVAVTSRRLLDAAHRQGVEVHVWTVNEPADMRRLVDLGVDGIVTDRADLALETLR